MWKEFLAGFFGGGVGVAAAGFIVRSAINHYLSKDLMRYKVELERAAYEHQVRFSRLHDRRAAVIAELYSRLVDAKLAVADLTQKPYGESAEEQEQRDRVATKATEDLLAYYRKNKIFFSQELCGEKISALVLELAAFSTLLQLHFPAPDYRDVWQNAMKWLSGKAPQLTSALEEEFRRLLGVERGGGARPPVG